MWIITAIKMWSLPKSRNKSILDHSRISLSSYFVFKFPFFFYKLLSSTWICEQHAASRGLLSFCSKWETGNNTSMPQNPCLCLRQMALIKNCTVAPCCKRNFQIFFLFTEVNFAVLGQMSHLCKGLWCRYPQARPRQANNKSKAAEMDNVLLLQMSYPGLGAASTRPSHFWYPSTRLWVLWRILHSLACLEQTHRSPTKYLIFSAETCRDA